MTTPWNKELSRRAESYAQNRGLKLNFQYPLGSGIDGYVWRTSRRSALKLCERDKSFRDEVECYRRLREGNVSRILGFAVPRLIDFDDSLKALEISVVSPPFLLDFGKVYLDTPPPYWNDAEIMGHWHIEGKEHFGTRWPKVLRLIGTLQKYGIWYIDPKPGNIMFAE